MNIVHDCDYPVDNSTMDLWIVITIPLVSALTGLITTGVVMAVGGLGVLRSLNRRLLLVEERIEDTDTRITKEVKRRASDAAVEAKRTSAEQMATNYMAQKKPQEFDRPKVVG